MTTSCIERSGKAAQPRLNMLGAVASFGFGLAVLSPAVAAGEDVSATAASGAVAAWSRDRAVPLATAASIGAHTDLQVFKRIVGRAHLVALGEGAHGGHEYLTFRNRLFAFLVEEMGFTAIAVETDFAAAAAANRVVLGVDPPHPAATIGMFSFLDRPLAENQELLDWMRTYNRRATTKRKIQFYGMDMMGGKAHASDGLAAALEYVASVDASLESELRQRLISLRAQTGGCVQPAECSAQVKDMLTAALADLVSLFERRQVQWVAQTSFDAYEWAYRHALNARRIDADSRAAGWWNGRTGDPNQRDYAMADNMRWLLQQEGSKGRVLVFAHNMHIRKGPSPNSKPFTAMGEHLRIMLGPDTVQIGTLGAQGSTQIPGEAPEILRIVDTENLNRVLQGVRHASFVLDWRDLAAGSREAAWLNEQRIFVGSGSYAYSLNPRESFDALVFFQTITPLSSPAP